MAGGYIGTAPATRDPTVSDDSVSTAKIQDNAVTGAKIAMTSDASGDILTYTGTDYARLAIGTAGQALKVASGGTAVEWATDASGTGDVVGPGSSTDDALAKYDGTTGKIVQNSNATLTDAGVLTVANIAATIDTASQPNITGVGTISTGTWQGTAIANAYIGTSIDATILADGTVTNAEFQYIGGLTSDAQTQINAKGDAYLAVDQNWTGSQRAPLVTDNDGSFDQNGGNNFFCTPAANVTITFTNHTGGQSGYILFDNAGGHTISLHANTKGDANLASTLSTAGTYLVSYLDNGTNAYLTTSAVFA